MPAFIILILCFLVFTTESFANILIEEDSAPLTSSIGDTISLTARSRLKYGEHLVKWEIVYGSGTIIDEHADSTGFVPSTDSVAIRMATQVISPYEITSTAKKFIFEENSTMAPYRTQYGIRCYFNTNQGGQYAIIYENQQMLAIVDMFEDSTFTASVPTVPTDSFKVKRDCFDYKCFMKTQPNKKNYVFFFLSGYPNIYMKDSLRVKLVPSYTLEASHSGSGTALVDSLNVGVPLFSKIIEGDSIKINAVPSNDNVFDHWEKESGTCTIQDDQKESTQVINIKSNCKVKAVFTKGKVYTITNTPTKYNFKDNIYANTASTGRNGVRFTFTAPSSGSYAIVASNEFTQDSLYYVRSTVSDYSTEETASKFLGTFSENLNLSAGETVYIVIANTKDQSNPFFISYSTQSYSLTLGTDGNGKTKPANGYATAYSGTNYSIAAEADPGYRFSNWQTVSGNPVIDDSEAPYTYVMLNGNAELKAKFKQSSICTLTKSKQTFNFQKNYYSENTLSEIRFTWTPPDTNTYVFRIEPVNTISAIFKEFGEDKNFAQVPAEHEINGTTSFKIKGTPGTPLYWTIRDSSTNIPNISFEAWISSPYVLNVKTAREGSINPSGTIYTSPGDETILTAWPYGGYKFKSWINTEGDMTISTPNESRTSVSVKDSICTIKATFKVDEEAEPLLNISKLDISNYPEICAQVSVTDANSGHSFIGLVSDDFVLTQDGKSIQPQVTSINNVTGVSVVIVIDESTSMTINNRMEKAIEAIRDFINNMGPYDRTAIVGFKGGDSTVVHQTMTSDQTQLIKSLQTIKPDAKHTNIITGTYVGIQQIENETNPTAVIVFSDGDNNSGSTQLVDAVNLAKNKNTTIYSIALESKTKYPLEDLAKHTGGTFSIANDASELGGLYAAIRDNVLSQYIVCYQTPDTTQNGETHDVNINMTFNKIKTSDSSQWSEKSIPPIIVLTENTWSLINNSQPSNNPLTISVYIKSALKIESASLFLREASSEYNQFTSYALQHVSDSLWAFTVPANLVVAPGLDFYVIALDTAQQIGKSPKIPTPSKEPYTIFVDNDIPAVEVVSVACEDTTRDTKTFTYSIKDSDGISEASLFFRDSRMVIFEQIDLLYSAENDTWTTEFPANVRDFSGIDYYVRVTDARGATVRYLSNGFSTTNACVIRIPELPDDTNKTDTIPEDTTAPSPRDSIIYSLIADTAEIYDKDLDGRADFVRIHFKEERDDNITSIDSIFWNSNRGEWRYVPEGSIKKNRHDGTWVEAYINRPYKYGLTRADTIRKPFLSFTTIHSDKLENVKLTDRVGAVPIKASKLPGRIGLEEYMNPKADLPPDTLIILMSEPIFNTGKENAWQHLFRISESCEDTTVSQEISLKQPPEIKENGQQWTMILDGYSLKAGSCLFTDPEATYEDLMGNPLGRGGIKIEGKDGSFYLSEVKPLQAVSGIGKTPKWISPEGSDWETLPDTLSAVSIRTMSPYKADIYIFDGIGTFVANFKQKFGYDGEMDDPARGGSGSQFKQGFLHWNQRSDKGRKVGTGIYIWKILFTFDDGHKETRNIKTGIYRRGDKKKKKN